ncbi:MAG TPA: M50 family metallopeptidase, partial [Candidatus Babeliales bacterium]|nr:M50 family metallopeptidase [Candidatus Babeliales bacterium]
DPEETDPEQIAKMNIPGKFFSNTPYWQKLAVMLGGILFNLILGFAIFSFLFTVGMPKSQLINPAYKQKTTIAGFAPGSAGFKAGLKEQDKIIAGNGSPEFTDASEVITFLRSNAGKQVHLTIEHNSKRRVVPVQLNPKGQIGVLFKTEIMPPYGFFESMKMGMIETYNCFWNVVNSFKSIITRKAKGDLAGPIRIIAEIVMGARLGYRIFLILLAFISINLAFLNMIPVPITDGGQILFNTIEAITGRPMSEKIRTVIHYISWISVLALFIVLSLKDILSLIGINISSILAAFTS